MIVSIRGSLLEKSANQVVIDAAGIGYEIEISLHTFEVLPEVNQPIMLLTHLIIREDAHLLFGFHNSDERELFRHLIKVNGVGPRLAMGILSAMTPADFVRNIFLNNEELIKQIPGVGKKTAERLRIEMKDRLKGWHSQSFSGTNNELNSAMTFSKDSDTILEQQAVKALVALGYKLQEASRMVSKVISKDQSLEEIIRQALRTTNIHE